MLHNSWREALFSNVYECFLYFFFHKKVLLTRNRSARTAQPNTPDNLFESRNMYMYVQNIVDNTVYSGIAISNVYCCHENLLSYPIITLWFMPFFPVSSNCQYEIFRKGLFAITTSSGITG